MHGRSCSLFERGVKWCGGAGNTRHVSVRQLRWCLPGSLCVCCFALGWLVGLSLRDLCCVLTEATRVGSAILVRVSPMFVDCCFGYSRFLLSCMGELVRVDMFVLHFSSSIFFCEKPRPVNFGRATVRDALRRYHGLWVWLDRHTWLVRIRSGRIGDTVRGVSGSRGLVWAKVADGRDATTIPSVWVGVLGGRLAATHLWGCRTVWTHGLWEANVLHMGVGPYRSGRIATSGGPGTGRVAKGWDVSVTPNDCACATSSRSASMSLSEDRFQILATGRAPQDEVCCQNHKRKRNTYNSSSAKI